MTERTFGFVRSVPVRFRDIDAMGHAHHSLVLVYIEEVRAAFWREVIGRPRIEDIDYVLAQVTVKFVQRIRFPGELTVALRVARIGESSFTMEYELRGQAGELLATAETVQVMYDYERAASTRLPADVRAALGQYA